MQLVDAPVWECGRGHQEIELPNAEQLHRLLASLVIRKPALLRGPEIRFLRKELGLSGRAFANRLGMTPEHLSRLETGRRAVSPTTSLLARLAVAWELTRRRRIEFPSDVQPLAIGSEVTNAPDHRVQYTNDTPRDRPWMSVSA